MAKTTRWLWSLSRAAAGLTLAAGLAFPGAAGAALIDRGGGLIYDTVLNITWLQDANYALTSGFAAANAVNNGLAATDNIFTDGRMGWDAAVAWADGLSYFDSERGMTWDDWRLPSADVNGDGTVIDCFGGVVAGCADNEMGHLFWEEGISVGSPGLFTNVQSGGYWSGSEFAPNPSLNAWLFFFGGGGQGVAGKNGELFAWAVRPGDVVAQGVPEPGTAALLGAALGLLGLRRRARRHSMLRSAMRKKLTEWACLALALGWCSSASALTIDAFDSGWYNSLGAHDPVNDNYIVGQAFIGGQDPLLRDFFAFDLSSVPGTVNSATFRVFLPIGGYAGDPTETFSLFDVTSDLDALLGGTGGVAAYNDLGTGVTLGSRNISLADEGFLIDISLNAAALASINAALGGQWAIGGAVTTVVGATDQYIFAFSDSGQSPSFMRQLILQTGPVQQVPEPPVLALLGLALAGLGIARRRGSLPPAARRASARRARRAPARWLGGIVSMKSCMNGMASPRFSRTTLAVGPRGANRQQEGCW